MKKTLLMAAAALAAGVISTQAQVYSQNIVGYYNLNLTPGFNLVAVQLTASSNNFASEVLPNIPDSTTMYAWDNASSTFIINIYDTGSGSTPPSNSWYMSDYSTPTNEPTIKPGQAVFLQVPTSVTNTVVGSVVLSNNASLLTGFNMVGSALPIGGVANGGVFNLNPPDSTTLYTYDSVNNKYVITIYDTGGGSTLPTNSWYMSDYSTPTNAPTMSVGQGAFLQLPSSWQWSQNLTN